MTKKKVCCRCGLDKPINDYARDVRNKDKYRYECKLCQYKSQIKSLTKKVETMEESND
jgi:transposase-like protein